MDGYELRSFFSAIVCNYADFLKELLVPIYSEKGTPEFPDEQETYMHFVDFLDECEGWLKNAYNITAMPACMHKISLLCAFMNEGKLCSNPVHA